MDGTGIITVLLWNREAMQLIGKSAKELKERLIPDDECSYPSELDDIIEKKFMLDDIIEKNIMWNDIIEKKFMFKSMVKESNINKYDEVYKVVEFVDDEVLFKEYSHPSLTYNNWYATDAMELVLLNLCSDYEELVWLNVSVVLKLNTDNMSF
ncbi:hypothetical protein CQW23_04060 [Capsicum baccatum]|uniref:PAS domain-containing protein n=1 Tax=Capsicum baccatum TaxID=33114 RepID=A0A2G2XDK1_CAPBA|nr:hypothetical protein CQW23_04060 [Capsicum baccatum]